MPDNISRFRFPPLHVVVLDHDDRGDVCQRIGGELRFIVSSVKDMPSARSLFKSKTVDILLVDPSCRAEQGHLFIDEVKRLHPDTQIVALASEAGGMTMGDAMRLGAIDYLVKPIDPSNLANVLERTRQQFHAAVQGRRFRERLRSKRSVGPLVGHSSVLQRIRQFIFSVANSDHPVLLLGEMGSGKKSVARYIHINSNRASQAFLLLDCSCLSPALHGSELFGHEAGAFRGAEWNQRGLLVTAQSGTIVLEEIADLPLNVQFALLKALQGKKISPIGSTQLHPISVRIVATTSRDIRSMVEQGLFRKDLFQFLNLSNLRIAPLREHKDDIPEIVKSILDRISREVAIDYKISDELFELIISHDWLGNVTELESALEYACSRSSNGLLTSRDFSPQYQALTREKKVAHRVFVENRNAMPNNESFSIAEAERKAIFAALQYCQGDKTEAAHRLGIGKTTLYRKLKEYGFDVGKETELAT
jgi:DNA-binding NtrC family response regulator